MVRPAYFEAQGPYRVLDEMLQGHLKGVQNCSTQALQGLVLAFLLGIEKVVALGFRV